MFNGALKKASDGLDLYINNFLWDVPVIGTSLFTYTPQSHSPQKYTHHEAAGSRYSPAASFVLCLCRSHI